jgi:hypothetical protein
VWHRHLDDDDDDAIVAGELQAARSSGRFSTTFKSHKPPAKWLRPPRLGSLDAWQLFVKL